MVNWRNSLRKAGTVSKRDATFAIVRALAVAYQIGFGLYLPASKYLQSPNPLRYRWFAGYGIALLLSNAIPYIPKTGSKKWKLAEIARIRCTGVAISRLTASTREQLFRTDTFREVVTGLLTAVKQEVESVILDSDGVYVNATLLTEDPARPDNLRVRARANPTRMDASYPKDGMVAWQAMVEKRRKYDPNFTQAGKDYRSVLALPLLLVDEENRPTTLGVVSIDSGRSHEFDGLDESIETRLVPYISLIKLALTMESTYADRN